MNSATLVAAPSDRTNLAAAAPRETHPAIIPRGQSALRSLMVAMSIMCYLACIAIGGLILVNRAIATWTSDIAREVTVQVVPRDGSDLDREVEQALAILRSTPGVARSEAMSHDAAVALLEPWLGSGRLMRDLPVPRLITVEIDPRSPPNLAALAARIEGEVRGATVDTHLRWQGELTRLAAVLQWLGTAILVLITVSAATLVVHVTRSALDANRQAVEVLYLVGARDRFIAREVEKRLLLVGFRAGLAGAAGGICTFAMLSLAGSVAAPRSLAEASRNLVFGPPETTATIYGVFLLVPIVATLICLVTARAAVLRILRSLF